MKTHYNLLRIEKVQAATRYEPPTTTRYEQESALNQENRRGPLLYLGVGGLIGAAIAIPLVADIPISADPNPLGYLIVLLGVPLGGVIYRIRARRWPIDRKALRKQIRGSFCTLLLPGAIALSTGMRAKGLGLTIIGALVSTSVIVGIFVSGRRRGRKLPYNVMDGRDRRRSA